MLSDEYSYNGKLALMLEELEDQPEAIAARLQKVRAILDMSKKDFAEKAGLTMQTYGPFENAKRDLSLQSAKLLRKTYQLRSIRPKSPKAFLNFCELFSLTLDV